MILNSNLLFIENELVSSTGFSFESLYRGIIGIVTILFIAYLFSSQKNKIAWKTIVLALVSQLILGILILKVPFIQSLFEKAGAKSILEYPSLEADDCIAITAKHILEKHPDVHIHIITSDMDYLQIAGERVTLVDLKYKKLTDSKNSFKDAKKDLFCKIVCGDKSDNIPSIFPRCGLKTAAKLYDNPEEFKAKLEKTPGAKEIYERNQKIIDFNYIPKNEMLRASERPFICAA